MERRQEYTLGWIVILAYLYDKISPKDVQIKLGISRARNYLSDLTKKSEEIDKNKTLLKRLSKGNYTLNRDAFLNKIYSIYEEANHPLDSNEKELLKQIFFSPFIKALLSMLLKQPSKFLGINPYLFLLYLTYITLKTFVYLPLSEVRVFLKEIKINFKEKMEEIKAVSLALGIKNEIEELIKESIRAVSASIILPYIENSIPKDPQFDYIRKIFKTHSEEFALLIIDLYKEFETFENLIKKTFLTLKESDVAIGLLATMVDLGIQMGYNIGKSVSSFLHSKEYETYIEKGLDVVTKKLSENKEKREEKQ